MKKICLLAAGLFLLSQTGFAQKTFKKAFANASGKRKIEINIENSQLEIAGYNGNEVVVETTSRFPGPPDRAKGLKPLYNGASDNTGLGLEIQESGGVMSIRKAISSEVTYRIKIPADAVLSIREIGWQNGKFEVRDHNAEIEIEGKSSEIKLENVSGPVVASSVNGNIEVAFSRLQQEKPSDISATNGFIDVALPADTKCSLDLRVINGDMYTDFDIQYPKNDDSKGLQTLHRSQVSGNVNGGGVELSLHTINGNIFLRKK